MFRTLTAFSVVALLSASVSAEVIMEQNFDDTSTFSPGLSGFHGTAGTTGGRWGDFHATNGSFITNELSLSGDQAFTVRRGGNAPIARVDNGITENEFEISYWVYRHAADSSIMVQVGNGDVAGQTQLGVYLNNGVIYVRNSDSTAWMTTNYAVAVNEWTRIRQHIFIEDDGVNYDLYRTQGADGTEQHLGNFEVPDAPTDIDRLRFNPQGTTGNLTSFDDILVTQVPEPASMGLMLIGGGLMLLRRRTTV